MLKMPAIQLQLITDSAIYLLRESYIRGGLAKVVKRHIRANNKDLPGFDSSKESSYILYTDANALYSHAMKQMLPTKGGKFIEPTFDKETILNI